MTIKRRTFNNFLLAGVAGGVGFAGGRFSAELGEPSSPPQVPREALRELAGSAPGIHQIGLQMNNRPPMGELEAESQLLARLFKDQSTPIQLNDLQFVLNEAVGEDYSAGRLATVHGYKLSQTEVLYTRYALQVQGLQDVAFVPPEPEVKDGIIDPDAKFGPRYTVVGQIFNEQPDGHGGLWVQAKNTPPGTKIFVNGRKVKSSWKAEVITGAIYGDELQELIAKPSRHEIALFVPSTGLRQVVGELEVKPRPPAAALEDGSASTVFCEIKDWEVKERSSEYRIVIDTYCSPRSSRIYFGEIALKTRVRIKSIEAALDKSLLFDGPHEIRLVDTLSGEAVAIGRYQK